MQIRAVGVEPGLGAFRIRRNLHQQFPETRRMVHLDKMRDFMRVRFRLTQRLEADRAAWLLAFDIAQLAVLLFLTGGLQNPFAFLFLGPVLISATALPPRMA